MGNLNRTGGKPELFFLTGIRSNFYKLLPDALLEAEKRGYKTGILDVVDLVDGWKKYPNDWTRLGLDDHVTKLSSWFEVLSFSLRHRKRDWVVVFLYLPDRNIRPVWQLLSLFGARVGAMVAGPVPGSSRAVETKGVTKLLTTWWLSFKRWFKPRPYFWITSGSLCSDLYRSYFRTLNGVAQIQAHSIDYEKYRKGKELDASVGGSATACIAVLDQGWFTKPRPDFFSDTEYPPTSEEMFRRAMRRFLSLLERSQRFRVVIVCHPKADFEATKKLYEGFEVVQGDTTAVVRTAAAVVASSTTALQYAVLERRPVCLFTSNDLEKSFVKPLIDAYRRELQCPVVNIDHTCESEIDSLSLEVDHDAYDRFIDSYVKHAGSPDKPLWDIVLDGIESRVRHT